MYGWLVAISHFDDSSLLNNIEVCKISSFCLEDFFVGSLGFLAMAFFFLVLS